MTANPLKLRVLCDFSPHNLAALLRKNSLPDGAECLLAPFGHTLTALHNPADEFWSGAMDGAVIWTFPQCVIPTFQRVLAFEEFDPESLLAEVDAFADLLQGIPKHVPAVFLASWVVPGIERGWGTLELTNGIGIAHTLMRMNLRLAERLRGDSRFILLDAQRWLASAGAAAFNPGLWYASKTPFHQTVFHEAALDVLAAIDGLKGRNKRVLVLDLDDTLWGGVVGEVGWEKLRLGGHDPIGEAFIDFQKCLKQLSRRGILLAIVSKNEEATALEAIQKHPEMVLRPEDFAAWRINWQDKAANLADLMTGLNLGIASAVFLDDSPFERARVREALPEVLVPDLPPDPLRYPTFIRGLRCFDSSSLTKEDRERTRMYVADRRRAELKVQVGNLGNWLDMLELKVAAEYVAEANLERASQLFNKTNQMNLSTRRLPPRELLQWSRADGRCVLAFRVADRFGDYGLCGIAGVQVDDGRAWLSDFLLSCRVMGRGVEETMLCTAGRFAASRGASELCAEYLPTAKNRPCEQWLMKQGYLKRDGNTFRMPLQPSLPLPKHVKAEAPIAL